jgi:hypothetical protein
VSGGGSVFKQCWCRDPETGRKLHSKCPDLPKKGHGSWYYRYEAPRAEGERRRQPVGGPFPTRKDAQDELSGVLARIGGGGSAFDRTLKLADYLEGHQAGKVNLKERSRETDADAFRLYWIPALGHMRLVDVRRRHVQEALRVMMLIGRDPDDELRPEAEEMLRRMLLARAALPAAEREGRRAEAVSMRRGGATFPEIGLALGVSKQRAWSLCQPTAREAQSVRPLSPARVARMFAPFRSAMKAAVPSMLAVSPCDGVELPRVVKVRPLAWTPAREAPFRAELARRDGAEDPQEIWSAPDLRPSPVMVWLPSHAGAFLDAIAKDRLYALFCLATFCGLRRDEIVGLSWANVDLDAGMLVVTETAGGDGPKSEAGARAVPMPPRVVQALRAYRKAQSERRLELGPAWKGASRVFGHEDGQELSGQWVSRRFALLAFRAGLPPVRFHDLRHGTASLLKAAGVDTKIISAILGHSRTSFTDSVYVLLFPDIESAAMNAAAAVVPETGRGSR